MNSTSGKSLNHPVLTQPRYSNRMPVALSKLKPVVFSEALLVALDLDGGRDFQMGLTKVPH